jgi:hypothetical protein
MYCLAQTQLLSEEFLRTLFRFLQLPLGDPPLAVEQV